MQSKSTTHMIILVIFFLIFGFINTELLNADTIPSTKILLILRNNLDASIAQNTESALAKAILENGWLPVNINELQLSPARNTILQKKVLQNDYHSILLIAKDKSIPYVVIGNVSQNESVIRPSGISLSMVSMDLSAQMYSSTSGEVIKVFSIVDRASSTDSLTSQNMVRNKIAEAFAESVPLPSNIAQLNKLLPLQQSTLISTETALNPNFKVDQKDSNIAIVIGIEKYRALPPSEYSRNDAELMLNYLMALGFSRRNIEFLSDERATKSDLEKTIDVWLPNRVKSDSTVVVYYSGHGAPDPVNGDAYIVPFDGDPSYLGITGYPLMRLYERLAKSQASQVIVLMDSCFSGTGARSVLSKNVRSLVRKPKTEPNKSKVLVMTSSQGSEISTSIKDKSHGAFTYFFIQALQEGKRDMTDIYNYLKPKVSDEAKKQNVDQTPFLSLSADVEHIKYVLGN